MLNRANNPHASALAGREEHFPARDTGTITDPVQRDNMLRNLMAPKDLLLKVDAQVMLIIDIDETLVNGTVGRVIGFYDATDVDIGEEGEPRGYAPEDREKLSLAAEAKRKEVLKKYPLVQFRVPRGTRNLLIMPETFRVESPNGEVQVSRMQLPLILST